MYNARLLALVDSDASSPAIEAEIEHAASRIAMMCAAVVCGVAMVHRYLADDGVFHINSHVRGPAAIGVAVALALAGLLDR